MVSVALSVGVWLLTGFEETYCLHLQESGKYFFFRTSDPTPQKTQCHIAEGRILRLHCCADPKTGKYLVN